MIDVKAPPVTFNFPGQKPPPAPPAPKSAFAFCMPNDRELVVGTARR